jgi:hypothetical protein
MRLDIQETPTECGTRRQGGVHVSRDMIWVMTDVLQGQEYVEVNVELQQGNHTTIKADEDDKSSQESSNKSS